MAFLGVGRLSNQKVRQIIADHLSAKYGVPVSVENVVLQPAKDRYGNDTFADFDITEAFRRTQE